MEILVNDEKQLVADNCTIARLIEHLEIDSLKGMALAVNERVIARTEWENFQLSPNDNIILIKATQGG